MCQGWSVPWTLFATSAVASTLALLLAVQMLGPASHALTHRGTFQAAHPRAAIALRALHLLSHAVLTPGEAVDAGAAVRTLWNVAAGVAGVEVEDVRR